MADTSTSNMTSCRLMLLFLVASTQILCSGGFQQQSVATKPPRTPLHHQHGYYNVLGESFPPNLVAPLHMSSPAADDWYRQQQQRRRQRPYRSSSDTLKREKEQEKRTTEQEQQRILEDYQVPTTKQVLQFAIPAVGVWLCIPLLSMMDTSAVGSIAGTTQLAALNPAIAVMNYSSKLMSFLFSGTTAVMAAAMAADQWQQKDAKPQTAKSLKGVLQFSTLVGAGLGALLLVFAKPLLLAIIGGKADPFILATAMKYVKIRALGMPAAAMLGSAQTACLALGDSKMPLYATVVAGVANLILDVALIRHSHGWIGGAEGVAWGTSIAQFVAAGWVMKWLLSSRSSKQQQPSSTSTTRGFLEGRMSFKDVFRIPTKKTSKGFAPFVFPVITTQAGRSSASATIDHVVSSSLSTASMAANQILTSVYYGLIPIVESLSLAAQAFVPKITERVADNNMSQQQYRALQKEKSFAMRKMLTSFAKAAGVCGLIVGGIIGTLPLYSGVFTSDIAVRTIVANVVPLIFLTSLKHGLFCASEGVLLGQKDLKFLGGQYAVYTFLIPYLLLQVKQAALSGTRTVGLSSVWQIFVGYDIFRTLVQMGRIAWSERKLSREAN